MKTTVEKVTGQTGLPQVVSVARVKGAVLATLNVGIAARDVEVSDENPEGKVYDFTQINVRAEEGFGIADAVRLTIAELGSIAATEVKAMVEYYGARAGASVDAYKAAMCEAIDEYDKSGAVNGFYFNGAEFWLPRETRVSVMNTANILKSAGDVFMDLWLGSTNVNLLVDQVIQMLASLERYAFQCYNVTASHKAAVMAMASTDEVMAFDVTEGYPSKLAF